MQPSWVHVAVNAVNVSCPVLATRKFPADDCTSAAPPTVDSGEPLSTLTSTAPLDTGPVTVVMADGLGPAHDAAIAPNGEHYVALRTGPGVVALLGRRRRRPQGGGKKDSARVVRTPDGSMNITGSAEGSRLESPVLRRPISR